MNRVIESGKKCVKFRQLSVGNLFKDNKFFYIKTFTQNVKGYNAVNLVNGHFAAFEMEQDVIHTPEIELEDTDHFS